MGIVNSLFWKFLERLFAQVLGFAIQIVLAQLIEPAEFGTLAIVVVIINIASIFIQSGISTYIVVKKDLDDRDLSTLLCSSLIVAFVGYMILFCVSPMIEVAYTLPNLSSYIRSMSLIMFLYAINSVYTGLLEREMQFKALFLRSLVAIPISGVIGIWMAHFGYGIYSLIAQNLLNQLILSIILIRGVKKRIRLGISMTRLKSAYAFCAPVMIQSIAGEIVNLAKSLTISKIYSTEELGYYDKGATYSNYIFQGINTPIIHVLLPAFSKSQNNIGILKKNFLDAIKLNNMISLPIIMGFAAVSSNFVAVFLKEKWLFAVDYIIGFCIIRAIYISINLNVQILYVLKRERGVMTLSLIATLLSFVAYVITRSISPLVIVIGEILVTFVFLVCTIIYVEKAVGVSIFEQLKGYFSPIVGTLIMSSIVVGIGKVMRASVVTLIVQIIAGLLAYQGYALLFQRDEVRFAIKKIKVSFGKDIQ